MVAPAVQLEAPPIRLLTIEYVELMPAADLASLVSDRHLLSEMRAEVALWAEGTAFGQRCRVIEGPVTVESGGYEGRPLRLTVRADDPVSILATWPPPSQAVNVETWSNAGSPTRGYQESEEGATYPQVFGQPGLIRVQGSPAGVPATPVIPVTLNGSGTWDGLHQYTPWGDITTWTAGAPPAGNFGIVSAGWMYPGDSGASKGQIEITKDTGAVPPVWKTAWMYYGTDNLGQTVTLARLQNGVSGWGNIVGDGSRYYAHIPDPCSGIARKDWRGGLEGAGECARWALETSGRRSTRATWPPSRPLPGSLGLMGSTR